MPSGIYKRVPQPLEAPGSPTNEARNLLKAVNGLGGVDAVRALIAVPAKEFRRCSGMWTRRRWIVPWCKGR